MLETYNACACTADYDETMQYTQADDGRGLVNAHSYGMRTRSLHGSRTLVG
jgi:hypothetical protein